MDLQFRHLSLAPSETEVIGVCVNYAGRKAVCQSGAGHSAQQQSLRLANTL